MRKTIMLLTLILAAILLIGCGSPKQKTITESGGKTQEKQNAKALVIEKVGFLPAVSIGGIAPEQYNVIGRLKNDNSKYTCTYANVSATLYNADGVVIGNNRNFLAPVYPGYSRWYMAPAIPTGAQIPARTEIKITNEKWSVIPKGDIPKFEVIQQNIVPSQFSTQITGIVRYSGTEQINVAVVGVLLDSGGNPIGCGRQDLQNVGSGDLPFSIDTFLTDTGATDVEVTPFKTE